MAYDNLGRELCECVDWHQEKKGEGELGYTYRCFKMVI